MKTSPRISTATLAIILAVTLSVHGDIVSQWTFEGDTNTPAIGLGTATLIGGTTASYATGNGGGRGWNTTTYPAQSTASGTAGVQFNVSTLGFEDVQISYDQRASGTASRWAQLDYSLDGGASWTTLGNTAGGLSPHDTFYSFNFDLISISGVNDNADFAFRIVSIFSPNAFDQNATLTYGANEAYQRANNQSGPPGTGTGTGDYGTAGTWRFDNVTVSATAVPEPATGVFLGVGLAALLFLRRRK